MSIAQIITDWWPYSERDFLADVTIDYDNLKTRAIENAIASLYLKLGVTPIPTLSEIEAMDFLVQQHVAALAMEKLLTLAVDLEQSTFQSVSESYPGAGSSSVSFQSTTKEFVDKLQAMIDGLLSDGWPYIWKTLGPAQKESLPIVLFTRASVKRYRPTRRRW